MLRVDPLLAECSAGEIGRGSFDLRRTLVMLRVKLAWAVLASVVIEVSLLPCTPAR